MNSQEARPFHNSAVSIRARLLNLSRQSGEDFQSVLTRYAIERFLYRLGVSEQHDLFILKGAILFTAWQGHLHRPTKDVDLLGFGSASLADVAGRIRAVASVSADDGIVFDPDTVQTERIAEVAEYEGVRAKLVARLEQARIRMQIDVGFGDAVEPDPTVHKFPAMLKDIAQPELRMYPAESVIAEKLHAMVVLDIRNSRMKDYFDLWYLAKSQAFDAATLRRAAQATFERRQTPFPDEIPFGLTDGFLRDTNKALQWQAFLRRLELEATTPDLPGIGVTIAQFLLPLFSHPARPASWNAGGPWRE